MPFTICAYKDQKSNGAGPISGDSAFGTIVGHHIIPDHCFYYTSGLRGKGDLSGFLATGCVGYSTADAPVIMVTADQNGGKSRQHGAVHQIFDPIELAASLHGAEWTYGDARAAAAKSLKDGLGVPTATTIKALNDYFANVCGLEDGTLIRAGEHGTMKSAPAPRRSTRERTTRPMY